MENKEIKWLIDKENETEVVVTKAREMVEEAAMDKAVDADKGHETVAGRESAKILPPKTTTASSKNL